MAPYRVAPWTRVAIMLVALAGGLVVARATTGSFLPKQPQEAIIFQNALLLIVLGSAVVEHRFTKPADSVVNGLMGLITLLTVYQIAAPEPWWIVTGYCTAVFVIASICTVASTGSHTTGLKRRVAQLTYRPAVVFGRARLLYSIVFLYAVLQFYGVQDPRSGMLVAFWGLFMAVWPLRVPQMLTAISDSRDAAQARSIGSVIRSDWPDLVRIELVDAAVWSEDSVYLYAQADGRRRAVLPLYTQVQAGAVVGTALCGPVIDGDFKDQFEPGRLYHPPAEINLVPSDVLTSIAGDNNAGKILGFVVEDSSIADIRFETWAGTECHEGKLVWCNVGEEVIYYQITAGITREKGFAGDRHGFQVAAASQLGILDVQKGFKKFAWLPAMTTPVFAAPDGFGDDVQITIGGDFKYGEIPGTKLQVGGPFVDTMEYHTAILGVTGSGKTELALDLLRSAAAAGVKVICVDITSKYKHRLNDLSAEDLSIQPETSADLSERLFAVETGTYGAPQEKKALNELAGQLRHEVHERLTRFLEDTDSGPVGIITLEEISNTKATIFITELFLTSLLTYARDNQATCPRVLVVIEEAHTVIPEANTMGLGDYDSRGLVGKIAQVALQGRKYGVGLLIVAQRTATVSKTVLTQCNTIITLNTFDETSLGFLKNLYGKTHTELIANLLPLQAVVYGKAVRAERPVMVEIPFNQAKADLGSRIQESAPGRTSA